MGLVQLEAEPVYNRSDYGFAVKFVDVPADTLAKLDRVIEAPRPSRGRSS